MRTTPFRFALVYVAAIAAACGRSTPSPPSTQPSPGEKITGSERLGWDQRADGPDELASFHYAIYVDGVRSELAGVSCASTPQAAGFACDAPLPAMSVGTHTLQLATFIFDGTVLESARSASFVVTKSATATSATATWRTSNVTTVDGAALRADVVASGLVDPTDMAFAPDGRLFVAERAGRIVVIDQATGPIVLKRGTGDRQLLLDDIAVTTGAGGLLALAVDPQFARTHYVYAVYTSTSQSNETVFRMVRLREAHDTFADRVVLLDDVPASNNPTGALRFGPDDNLYAAFDDGGNASFRGDLSRSSGKVLRLNVDGSTPADQAAGSPVFSWPFGSPRALAWNGSTHALWVADVASSGARIDGVTVDDTTRVRGTTRARYALPARDIAGMTSYGSSAVEPFRGDLLVAAGSDRYILRVRFDSADPFRVTATERLLQDVVGPVRAITVGAEGAIYFATDNAVGKLAPDVVDRNR